MRQKQVPQFQSTTFRFPSVKGKLLKEAQEQIEQSTYRYMKGEITEVERYTKVIDTWSETTARLTEQVVENFDKLNPRLYDGILRCER